MRELERIPRVELMPKKEACRKYLGLFEANRDLESRARRSTARTPITPSLSPEVQGPGSRPGTRAPLLPLPRKMPDEDVPLGGERKDGDGPAAPEAESPGPPPGPAPAATDTVEVTQLYSTARLVLVFLSLCCCMLLVALDVTIVATAIPTIVSQLQGAELYAWVQIAYALTSTAVQPIYGKASDIFGRKSTLIFATSIFLLGSALAGASTSMIMLVISRAVQGLGGGGTQALIFIIVSEIVAPRQRGKYQGMLGAVWGLASVLGPLIGGLFTEYVGWRWAFFINLPIGAVAVIACIFLLRVPKREVPWQESLAKIDIVGIVTLLVATILTCLALEWGGRTYPWNSPIVLSCLIVGIIFFPIFALVEIKVAKDPIIPMQLFSSRNYVGAVIAAFFHGGVLFSLSFYLPLWFQVVRGQSATLAGVLTIPFMISVVCLSISSGLFMSKTGIYVPIAQGGAVLMTIGLPLIAIWTLSSPTYQEVLTQILTGIGVGALLQTLILTVQVNAPMRLIGPGTASVIFLRTLGGVFGIAVFATCVNQVVADKLVAAGLPPNINLNGVQNLPPEQKQAVQQAYVEGLRLAYFVLTAFGGCAMLATFLIRHVPLSNMMQTKRGNVDDKTAANAAAAAEMGEKADGDAKMPMVAME
ncbi:major facilitator superfamily domain-containing protein [Hyaloraphidium curvatum]|nr:major facilitator superfamily domain-containing protein [Hyaloraphidium curvatum]